MTLIDKNSRAKIRVYVDERERMSDVPKYLTDMGITIIYKNLDICDYVLPEDIGIERKNIRDLVKSVFDGRLMDQARRMSETYSIPILIIEGCEPYGKYTSRPEAIRGAVSSIILDYEFRVLHTLGPLETAQFIVSLTKRIIMSYKGKGRIVIHKKPKLDNITSWQLYILQSLPFVGPKLARRLLETFSTVENVFTASVAELSRVEGIGYERATKIVKVLKTPYKPLGEVKRIKRESIERFILDNKKPSGNK